MSNANESHSIAELKSGILQGDAGRYICLECGAEFTTGEIYPIDGRYFDASAAAAQHVQAAHGLRLEQLLASGNRYLGLTDHQRSLMRMFATGLPDAEIAEQTGTTAATVRRQRFTFREKAKQARMFLAAYELMEENRASATTAPPLPEMDPSLLRRQITPQEYTKALQSAFYSQAPLRLRALPAKDKRRIAVIARIAQKFKFTQNYTEPEVNAILEQVHPTEYVVLRRYLVEYGFLAREKDGSRYWKLEQTENI